MSNFLSNDRKVILLSGVSGVAIMIFLMLSFLTKIDFLKAVACIGIIFTYWNLPTWFSRDRQLVILRDKCFNADNEQLKQRSFRENMFWFAAFLITSTFLIMYAYDITAKHFTKLYPQNKELIFNLALTISIITPYLVRHIYCFIINRPMDTSFQFPNSYSSYRNSNYDYICTSSNDYITNPAYSSLSCNMFHSRHR